MRLLRVCLCACWLALSFTAFGQAEKFELVKLADGIYATIRKEPPGLAVESNSLFIICERDVIVVDAQSNVAATSAVLAALRRVTTKPVRYVINTHWHDDHIVGNQVYAQAFPGVDFIAHANTRAYLPNEGMTNREKFHAGIPLVLEQLRSAVQHNKNLRGEPLSDEERASYLSDIALAEGYMTVPRGFQPILPTITVTDQLTLYHGGRTVEIRYLGRGHTSGDLVVYLPQERIVAAGDLVIWPVPLIGAEQSHVGDWAVSLTRLRALQPRIIVPGHGPVMRDDLYVQLMTRLFSSVQLQTAAAVARGETLEQVRKSVNLEELRKLFAGDSKVRNALFSIYVTGPAVASAYHDATSKQPAPA